MEFGDRVKYSTIIRSCYPSLSKTEKKIADYILEEKSKIIYQPLLEISQNIGVGEATIIRFARKIGFNGFQDLKLEIAKEVNFEGEEDDATKGYHNNHIEEYTNRIIQTVTNTKAILNLASLNLALEIINNAKRVFFYGVGSSGFSANAAQNRFMRYGIIGISVVDPHFQSMYSSICNKDDVIIVFSLSGYTKDIIDSVEIAKKEGAKIIAITSMMLSPIAQLADCLLLTAGKENPLEGGSITGIISQLYMIDLLCLEYMEKNKKNALKLKEKTAKAIIPKSAD